jgi:hypothetical protein
LLVRENLMQLTQTHIFFRTTLLKQLNTHLVPRCASSFEMRGGENRESGENPE